MAQVDNRVGDVLLAFWSGPGERVLQVDSQLHLAFDGSSTTAGCPLVGFKRGCIFRNQN